MKPLMQLITHILIWVKLWVCFPHRLFHLHHAAMHVHLFLNWEHCTCFTRIFVFVHVIRLVTLVNMIMANMSYISLHAQRTISFSKENWFLHTFNLSIRFNSINKSTKLNAIKKYYFPHRQCFPLSNLDFKAYIVWKQTASCMTGNEAWKSNLLMYGI